MQNILISAEYNTIEELTKKITSENGTKESTFNEGDRIQDCLFDKVVFRVNYNDNNNKQVQKFGYKDSDVFVEQIVSAYMNQEVMPEITELIFDNGAKYNEEYDYNSGNLPCRLYLDLEETINVDNIEDSYKFDYKCKKLLRCVIETVNSIFN